MGNKKNIFQSDSLWKLSLKVVLPSLIVTLLFGIYIFIDQLLMQQIVPENGINFLYDGYLSKQFNNEALTNIMTIVYNDSKNDPNLFNPDGTIILENALKQANKDTIFLSVTSVGTVNLLFLSIGFFINSGASVIYSRSLAKKNYIESKEIWNSTFYSCLISSLIILVIMLPIQNYIINLTIPSQLSGTETNPNVLEFFKLKQQAALNFASDYTYFITASIPFVMITNLLIFFIRAEGKNIIITSISLIANFFNIMFDLIFFFVLKTNIMGGGIATFSGYIINLALLCLYTYYLERKNEINFSFKDLVLFKIKRNYLLSSFALSLGTFLRDLALAIANIVYIPIFTETMDALIKDNAISSSYLNDIFSVSATPIYNLFFFAMYGIIDGMRPILAYNYQQQNYKRVKQTYYAGAILGATFAVLVNIILFSSLTQSVLEFFNAGTESRKQVLLLLFYSTMFQLPFVAISISGLSLFQSNGKMFMTILLSLFQGLICFVPMVLMMSAIAKATLNSNVMLFAGFSNIVISSILIDVISEVYLHVYMGKKEKSSDPLHQVDMVINWIDAKLKPNKKTI